VAVELDLWERLFAERTRSGHGNALAAVLALANVSDVISFAGGFPEPATFPVARFQELFASLDETAFQYAPTAGLPGIRDFLAGRLDPRPEEGGLMVTSGSIEALELCGKAMLEPGDRVVVEGPTYMGAIMSFQSFEADVAAVPMDEQGMDVEALHGLSPKLVYTIPDYQNPMGVSMSAERRRALVELARRDGFLVVEDVAYRELGWEEHQPPSLRSLGPDVVLQAGTFSKIFFPGVRLGWAAGPPEVVARLVWAKQLTDQCAGALGQRLLEEHGRRGWLDEQIAAARALYRVRCEATLAALDRHLAGRAEWTRPAGGFFTWLTLPVDAAELARRAIEAKVAFVPGLPFYADGRGTHEARLSFSRVTEGEIATGIERLASLL
jgi:2-aminoadipate transaminase